MFIDIFSRKIVGHDIDTREKETVAKALFEQSLKNESLSGLGLRLHNDNGRSMRAYTLMEKIKDLGVIQTFSRPYVKNDNPFAESLFKTLKYCPEYPYRPFRSIQEAEQWTTKFVEWYNNEHLHSGINYVSPIKRHLGQDQKILNKRRKVFALAKAKNPNRWSGPVRQWKQAEIVELNEAGCRLR